MMKYVALILVLVAAASAQFLLAGYPGAVSGPRYHNAFAASADTGIRRYGFTGGYYAAAPAPYFF